MYRRVFPALCVVLLACVSTAFGQRGPYTPEQLALVRSTSECRLSPDAETVAFVSDITGALELWTVGASGGWPVQLTNLGEQVTDIRWSPDGQWIAFTSDYGGNERHDLYRIPARGGPAVKLTNTPTSETTPRYSPDGRRVAFLADPDRNFHTQLHVLELAGGKTAQLTREPIKVQRIVWSPDGRTIALNRSGDDEHGDLLLVDSVRGEKTALEPGTPRGIVQPVAFSPDGGRLLVLDRNAAGFMQLALVELEASHTPGLPPRPKGRPRPFGPGQWDVAEAQWTREGIYVLVNESGATRLCRVRSAEDPVVSLVPPEGVLRDLSFDRSGRRMALLREAVHLPADAWVGETAALEQPGDRSEMQRDSFAGLKQVTFSLLGGVDAKELARGTMVAYESFDKMKIHARVVLPRANRLGTPPPAVVQVHGGPDGQTTLGFDPLAQVLAEAGFAVISPNYRGSSGYGKAFQDADNKDWGGGDLQDLAAAVRHFGRIGRIDAQRAGITGESAGGYLTLMALARTPEVWRAGVELYGMPDLVMDYMLNTSRFGAWYETEMGNPKQNGALFRERSPLPYLDKIAAPLLIFQGANDANVPKSESDLLVAVLRDLNKPHTYIVYEDEGHGFTRRKNLIDYYRRTAEFFTQHLRR